MIDVACQVNIINNSQCEVEDRLIYVYKGDLTIHRFLGVQWGKLFVTVAQITE